MLKNIIRVCTGCSMILVSTICFSYSLGPNNPILIIVASMIVMAFPIILILIDYKKDKKKAKQSYQKELEMERINKLHEELFTEVNRVINSFKCLSKELTQTLEVLLEKENKSEYESINNRIKDLIEQVRKKLKFKKFYEDNTKEIHSFYLQSGMNKATFEISDDTYMASNKFIDCIENREHSYSYKQDTHQLFLNLVNAFYYGKNLGLPKKELEILLVNSLYYTDILFMVEAFKKVLDSFEINETDSQDKLIENTVSCIRAFVFDDNFSDYSFKYINKDINLFIKIAYIAIDDASIDYKDFEEKVLETENKMLAKSFLERLNRYDHTPSKSKMTLHDLSELTGQQFEHFCKDLLIKAGYNDVEVTKASGDQGADVIATKSGVKWAVQCKLYSNKLTNTAIQEVVGAIKYYSCDKAMVITNSDFTQSARALAKANCVRLIDGEILSHWLEDYL
ncbi:restriction endonuclease [Francisella tularensis]|uniref:restriction endonuclease n=1 Tax=Francisella tularensis TaxID=263 RepID=UPI0008F601B0|nr:restriction endonuclease [Francisella tularensis]APA82516.1 hypothetical protein N894_0532 [Francisella tularensis subsp. novicida PA10-7858]